MNFIRSIYFFLFIALATCLVLPYFLTPSPTGMGTHQYLRLPPCLFWTFLGIKCPSCGLTTSLTHVTHGNIVLALKSHILGPALYGACMMLAILLLVGTLRPHVPEQFFSLSITRFVVDVGLVTWTISWLTTILTS